MLAPDPHSLACRLTPAELAAEAALTPQGMAARYAVVRARLRQGAPGAAAVAALQARVAAARTGPLRAPSLEALRIRGRVRPLPREILDAVALAGGVHVLDVAGRAAGAAVVLARHWALFRLVHETELELEAIADLFGGRGGAAWVLAGCDAHAVRLACGHVPAHWGLGHGLTPVAELVAVARASLALERGG